jgi:hypothetical protein
MYLMGKLHIDQRLGMRSEGGVVDESKRRGRASVAGVRFRHYLLVIDHY